MKDVDQNLGQYFVSLTVANIRWYRSMIMSDSTLRNSAFISYIPGALLDLRDFTVIFTPDLKSFRGGSSLICAGNI